MDTVVVPVVLPGETCSMYWRRLTPPERTLAQTWQRVGGYVTMTSWMLAHGCTPVYIPPLKPVAQREYYSLNMALRGATRRPAGHVR